MNPEHFEKKMENLTLPKADGVNPPVEIKLTIVNAQRSAALGIWFIAIPCYLLFCVFMKYYFHINLGLFDAMIGLMSDLDKNPVMKFLTPVLVVGLPLAGVVLNALAITHFSYTASTKTVQISIKLRWINLAVLVISLVLVSLFILYVIVENIHHAQFNNL
jgi:lantibiotic transport system permease protein